MECPACNNNQPDLPGARFCAICGTLLPRFGEADPLIGRTVGGRFHVKTLIAIGGMGRVYLAEQAMGATMRRVALKVLLADYTVNQDVVSRFMRECSTVAELEHPNTIKFFDWGQTAEGHLFIAMEYVGGPSLATVMRNEGVLAPERVDRIFAQICGSLQEAHDKGFVHRDLKPENILLATHAGEEDFVKVLDFGIAKRAGANVPKITQEGMVLGSPPYMSPEQFSRGELDARSDIYSLAVVAFKALTGKKPFRAEKAVEWATQHMTAAPLPFETTPAGAAVPANMRRAVYHALAKRPFDRPQSMREFYAELTLGGVRSSLLGRSAPPPRPVSGPPPALAPGGTVMLDPQRPAATRIDDSTSGDAVVPGAAQLGSFPPPQHSADRPLPPPDALPREMVPPTMREPVPPTVRADAPSSAGKVVSWIAGAALIVGAAFLISRVFTPGSPKPAPPRGGPTAAATAQPTTATPTPASSATTTTAPVSPTTAPQPTAAASTPAPSPDNACGMAIHLALQDRCEESLRWRKLCPETHPNHRESHVVYDLRCKK